MSCSMKRIRDDVFLSFTIFSIWLKYWSMRGWGKRKKTEQKKWHYITLHIPSLQETGRLSD